MHSLSLWKEDKADSQLSMANITIVAKCKRLGEISIIIDFFQCYALFSNTAHL